MLTKVRVAARLHAFLGALTMIAAFSVVSAASAAATVPVWSTNGTPLPLGVSTSFSPEATSVRGLNMSWQASGVHYEIECNTLSMKGVVENPTSGAALLQGEGHFQGCRVAEVGLPFTSCTIPPEIKVKMGAGNRLTNTPYANGGLYLASFVSGPVFFSNCPGHEHVEWLFGGRMTGYEAPGAWPGEIVFPEGTPATVLAPGEKGEIRFGINIRETGSLAPVKIMEH